MMPVLMAASGSNQVDPLGGFDIAQAMALSARSVKSRLAFAALFALASTMVLASAAAAAWLATVTVWELVGRPLTDRLLQGRSGAPALRQYAAFKCASAIIFGGLGGLTLASGEPLGAIIGAAWLVGSIMHTFVYYGSSRVVLVATMAPPCLWAGIGAIAVFGWSVEAFVGLAAVLSTLSGGVIFLVDRNALLSELERERLAVAVAEEASRSKSQFLATMSHELRTPLNAIIGYSEMMQEQALDDRRESDVADHDRVLSASRHLLGMISEILDLSKIEAGRMMMSAAPFDVARVAREALDAVRPLAMTRGNALHLDVHAADLGQAYNDAFRLHQCLINLLSNATKFTERGDITLRVRRDGALLVFAVEDTGIGIAPEKLKALFKPFVQADASTTRTHGGTGLGLVITRRLAELMGGGVAVESAPGKGSTFTLTVAAALELSAGDEGADETPVEPGAERAAA
jgi:signal transduction histidine kinase